MEVELTSQDSKDNQRLGQNGTRKWPNHLSTVTQKVNGLIGKTEFGMVNPHLSQQMESYDSTHLTCSIAQKESTPQDARWASGSWLRRIWRVQGVHHT